MHFLAFDKIDKYEHIHVIEGSHYMLLLPTSFFLSKVIHKCFDIDTHQMLSRKRYEDLRIWLETLL